MFTQIALREFFQELLLNLMSVFKCLIALISCNTVFTLRDSLWPVDLANLMLTKNHLLLENSSTRGAARRQFCISGTLGYFLNMYNH